MKELGKIWAAIWVPTDASGKLMKDEIKKHLKFLIDRKVEGIFASASTGEFTYLDVATRNELLKLVVENAGPMQVIANLSHHCPKQILELAKFAKQLPIAAISLLPPLYFPFNQVDIEEHFVRVAEHVELPLCLYNFPELAGNRLSIETIAAVANKVPVCGLKQSGGDFAYLIPLMDVAKKKKFKLFTGNDMLLPEAINLGVGGCIGGLVNAIPEILIQSFDPKHREGSAAKLKELAAAMASIPYPVNFGALIEARGIAVGKPKIALSTPTQLAYQKMVQQLRAMLEKWNLSVL